MRPKWTRAALVAFFVILSAAAYRAVGDNPQLSDEQIHRPTAAPDRIVLNITAEPATSAAVTWRTDTSVEKPQLEIAESEDGPDFVKKVRALPARSETFKSDLNEARYHSVVIRDLKPDTQYLYRVGDGFNWSEWIQFRTAAAGPAPLEFLYVGDAQNNIYSMWSRLVREAYAGAPKARFFVHAGDLINNANRDAQWGEWHRAGGWIHSSVASFPTPGNHEYARDSNGARELNHHWRPQFTLPENGVPGLEETNYYVDIQGVRMIALNSNDKQDEQAAWLDKLLSDNPSRWTIAAFHHPIFSTANGRDNKRWRELMQPIFDKHGVDLVLTGHDHTYGRSNLLSGVSKREGGTVYVVSVSGPKMYELQDLDWAERVAAHTQLFQAIRIDGDKLTYEARTGRGLLYDSFELLKQKGKPNRLLNRVPDVPERRKTD